MDSTGECFFNGMLSLFFEVHNNDVKILPLKLATLTQLGCVNQG